MKKLCGFRVFVFAVVCAFIAGSASVAAYASGFEWAIEPTFIRAGDFSEGLAHVRVGDDFYLDRDNVGFIDTNGNIIIEPQFYWAHNFSEGLARVRIANHRLINDRMDFSYVNYAFVDRSSNIIAATPRFSEAKDFSEGLAAVLVDDRWGYIDKEGNMVIEPQFGSLLNPVGNFSNGLAAVRFVEGDGLRTTSHWGFIDRSGNIVVELQYADAIGFSDGVGAVRSHEGRRNWYLIDTNGTRISGSIDLNLGWINSISEGRVRFSNGWYDGFMDTAGNIIVEPQFSYTTDFEGGVAYVYPIDNESAFIDLNGNVIRQAEIPQHGRPWHRFSEGLRAFQVDGIEIPDSDKRGFVHGFTDMYGNVVIEPQFRDVGNFYNGLAAAMNFDTSLWGFISSPHATSAQQSLPTLPPPQPTPPATTLPPGTTVLRFVIDSTTLTINNTPQTLEAAPFIHDGRTMVPLRVIGEALGATDLAMNDGIVSLVLNGETITMTIGEQLPNNMGAPVIVEGRTFVPLAYIVSEMGAVARWDADARAAYIYIA